MSLQKIQEKLKAPKSQYNSFGGYKYRNQEDILEALKPVLAEHQYSIVIGDTIELVSDRVYVKATATVYGPDMSIVASNAAYAREPLSKKGMDEAQITGAASSYARKYALNGLFALDDTKDADSLPNKDNGEQFISEQQASELFQIIDDKKVDVPAFLSYMKVDAIDKISAKDFQKAKNALQKAKGQAA